MHYYYILDKSEKQNGLPLLRHFRDHAALIRESVQQGDYFYYDTFDWRLYRDNYFLYFLRQKFYLYNYISGIVENEEEYPHKPEQIIKRFGGQLYHKIYPVINVRALINAAIIRKKSNVYRILNADEKTIGRLYLEQHKIKDKNQFKFISPKIEIKAVRGYAKQITVLLNKLPLKKQEVKGEYIFTEALKVLNRYPGDYRSKFLIRLSPRETVRESLPKIYLQLLTMLRKNEDGIINDVDIEFLHDFRIAVRRTRSALSQISGILDEVVLHKIKKDFKYLGKMTNRLRDLDVYLLREENYKEMLPDDLREYLNPFFNDLKKRRNLEHKTLVRFLKSARYKNMVKTWHDFLTRQMVDKNRHGVETEFIIDRARNIIWKRNRKVIEFGKNILLSPSDALMHQLRIEGKKLRYLLEFFSSLFAEDKMQLLIKKLKQLQDNLGEFNDLVVQQNTLQTAVTDMAAGTKNSKGTILSIGILIGKLHNQQESVKSEFAQTFIAFSSTAVQKIYRELFYQPVKGA